MSVDPGTTAVGGSDNLTDEQWMKSLDDPAPVPTTGEPGGEEKVEGEPEVEAPKKEEKKVEEPQEEEEEYELDLSEFVDENGKLLGKFDDPLEVIKAYKEAEKALHAKTQELAGLKTTAGERQLQETIQRLEAKLESLSGGKKENQSGGTGQTIEFSKKFSDEENDEFYEQLTTKPLDTIYGKIMEGAKQIVDNKVAELYGQSEYEETLDGYFSKALELASSDEQVKSLMSDPAINKALSEMSIDKESGLNMALNAIGPNEVKNVPEEQIVAYIKARILEAVHITVGRNSRSTIQKNAEEAKKDAAMRIYKIRGLKRHKPGSKPIKPKAKAGGPMDDDDWQKDLMKQDVRSY